MTIAEIASLYNVSERSIQYDLEFIETYKTQLNIEVMRNKSLGVKVTQLNKVSSDSNLEMDIHYSKNERKVHIILRLFESSKPISSQMLANLLNVSRRTVVEDLKSVQLWLEDHELRLEYMKNKGFVIEGNEKNLREAYAKVVNDYFHHSTPKIGIEIFSEEELEKIRKAVVSTLNEEDFQLVQVGIDGLIYHIIIAIHRAKDEFVFDIPQIEYDRLKSTDAFQLAIKITKKLENLFQIDFPKSEAAFITLHLLGARVTKLQVENAQHDISKSTKFFIQKVSAQVGVPLIHDHKLLSGLITHIQPAIHRMKFNMEHINPLKHEIMSEYHELVIAIKKEVWLLDEAFDVDFNEDEIAYLALHFASAIERLKSEETRKIKIILLCGSGVGTSQLLKSRIKNIYPELEILDAFSIYDISEGFLNSHGIDYILTTVPVKEFSVPTIEVSPFLNKEDRNNINHMINQYRELVITSYKTVGPSLEDVIIMNQIKTNLKVEDRNDAIRKSVQTLIDLEHVTSQYAEDIIQHLDKFGPYMVIGPHIALLHSNFDNVNVPVSMAIVHFEEAIEFGHDRFDPVKVVVILATSQPQIHLNALGQLSHLIMDNDKRDTLFKGNKEMIFKLIKSVSQS